MKRPFGVTFLAIVAGIAGLFALWRAAVFMGWVNFSFVGNEVSFPNPQWGQVIWAILLAAIWFWVAQGFWSMRAYAWTFGIYISLFTLMFSFFAILGSATLESEFVAMLTALIVFMYLNAPGVRDQFMEHEMSLLTPDQRAAVERANAANLAAAQAMAAPAAAPAPAAPAPVAPAPVAPPAPPTDPSAPGA
jgi:hypothetical protein